MASKDELLNQFAAIPLQNKIIATVLVIGLIFGGYYTLYYTGNEKKIKKLRTQINELDKSLLQKQAIANNLPKFRREVERLNQRLKEALSLLPDSSDIPDLLTKVADLAEKSGLKLKIFQLGAETPKEFYAEVPVDMTVGGTFHELAVFFDKIAKMPRIVNISNLEMSDPKERTSKMVLQSRFNAVTYRFLESPQQLTGLGPGPGQGH